MNSDGRIGAVVIGGDFQSLGVIRSLSEKNIPVFLLDYELNISRFSRLVKRKAIDYSLLDPKSFADNLIYLAENENLKGWVLFPNSDEVVKLLSINRDKLEGWYRNPVPPWEVVEKFYFKQHAYKIAEKISIPIPRMYHGKNLDELLNQELRFPIALKPSYKEKYFSVAKKKGVKVEDIKNFIIEYKKMSSIIDSSEIIVQEMIEGGGKNLYSHAAFFDGEKIIAGISARRLRQHPLEFGHATTYAETVVIPELEDMANKILREIGYYGIAEVEFMMDNRDKTYKFIEINGRVWGWHTLAKAAGINLPYIQFQHITEQEIENLDPDLVERVKWIRLATDIPTSLKELFTGRMKLKDYLNSIKGKKEYAVFSIKDPLPFFMEFVIAPCLWRKKGF